MRSSFRSTICCLFSLILLAAAGGCDSSPKIQREEVFGPAKVRIHPTFTQVKDWDSDGKGDGVEAVVELLDSYDEPTRGSGWMLFELSEYRSANAQPAERRVSDPWRFSIQTREEQMAHWNTALRAYTFQLPKEKLDRGQTYVLDVTFETEGGANKAGGGRLFDRVVIEPAGDLKKDPKKVKSAGGRRPGH